MIEVTMAVFMKIQILWNMKPCKIVNSFQNFGGVSYPHFQGMCSPRRVSARTDRLHYINKCDWSIIVMGNILWMVTYEFSTVKKENETKVIGILKAKNDCNNTGSPLKW
jgi:hypothetical protein